MGKFMCVHPVGSNMDPDAAAPLAKAIKANSTTDAYWIRSWYAPEEGKFYCEWDAKDADSVREGIGRRLGASGDSLPLGGSLCAPPHGLRGRVSDLAICH